MMKKIAVALVALTMVSTPAHAAKFWGKDETPFESPRGGISHTEVCYYRLWIKVSCVCRDSAGVENKGPCDNGEGVAKPTKPPLESTAKPNQQQQRANPVIKKGPALKPG